MAMTNPRHYSVLDQICLNVDTILQALTGKPATSRSYPAQHEEEPHLSQAETKHVAALMRVNHSGEVCAQALYQGQGLVSRHAMIREQMQNAAREEGDHLAWCHERIMELGSHTSYLNPFWYLGSFSIGLVAGLIGDKWSLGFLAETESQVVQHLEKHLQLLPESDKKSAKILAQMREDENQHREEAIQAGAAELPVVVIGLMKVTSKVMVNVAYWI